MQIVRRDETISARLCALAILVMLVGFLWSAFVGAQAPSQEAINMRQDERYYAMVERVQKLETATNVGMGGLVLNFMAHLFQIKATTRRRRRLAEDDGDE